jgi:hypothetical protein
LTNSSSVKDSILAASICIYNEKIQFSVLELISKSPIIESLRRGCLLRRLLFVAHISGIYSGWEKRSVVMHDGKAKQLPIRV